MVSSNPNTFWDGNLVISSQRTLKRPSKHLIREIIINVIKIQLQLNPIKLGLTINFRRKNYLFFIKKKKVVQ